MSKPQPRHAKHADQAQTLDLLGMDAAAFEDLYRSRIEPLLAAREAERQADVATYWRRTIVGGAGVAVIVALALANAAYEVAFFFGFGGFLAVGSFAYWPLSTLYADIKEHTLTTIAGAIGCRYLITGFYTS